MWEGRRHLGGVWRLLSHRAFAELCLNFTVSKVQENLEKLQYEVRGSARRGGWERAKRGKALALPCLLHGTVASCMLCIDTHYYLNTQRPCICLHLWMHQWQSKHPREMSSGSPELKLLSSCVTTSVSSRFLYLVSLCAQSLVCALQ